MSVIDELEETVRIERQEGLAFATNGRGKHPNTRKAFAKYMAAPRRRANAASAASHYAKRADALLRKF